MLKRDVERFWSKVDVRGPDECWPWKEGKYPSGYGNFYLDGGGVAAHRVALTLKLGRPIKRGRLACHKPVVCHNRACCNPAHIYEGTRVQNGLDRRLDGTASNGDQQGESNNRAKLSGAEAEALLRLKGTMTQAAAGRLFGVSHTHVKDIWNGRRWPHLQRG